MYHHSNISDQTLSLPLSIFKFHCLFVFCVCVSFFFLIGWRSIHLFYSVFNFLKSSIFHFSFFFFFERERENINLFFILEHHFRHFHFRFSSQLFFNILLSVVFRFILRVHRLIQDDLPSMQYLLLRAMLIFSSDSPKGECWVNQVFFHPPCMSLDSCVSPPLHPPLIVE